MALCPAEMPVSTVMRLRQEDLERCYQLVMKRIAQYDLDERRDNPEYRKCLVNQSNGFLNEFIRRRWLM